MAALMVGASNAKALRIDATIGGIFTDSTLSTPIAGVVIDGNGNATATLSAGQVILVNVHIDNTAGEAILVIGASITFQGDQTNFIGAIVPNSILQEAGAGGASLENIGTGQIKPGSPGFPGDVWLQAVAYGVAGGVDGSGTQTADLRMFFTVTGASGDDTILFDLGLTPGDGGTLAPDGEVVPTTYSGAVVNVPEPGTVLLVALGLLGLAGGRRRMR